MSSKRFLSLVDSRLAGEKLLKDDPETYERILGTALSALNNNIGERFNITLQSAPEIKSNSSNETRNRYRNLEQIAIDDPVSFNDITPAQVDNQIRINREMKLANERQLGTFNGEALRNVVQYRHKPTWETRALEEAIRCGMINPSTMRKFTKGGLRSRQGEWTEEQLVNKFVQNAMDMGQGIDVLYGGPISQLEVLDAGHIYSADKYPDRAIDPNNTRWEYRKDNSKWQELEGSHLYRNVLKSIISAGRDLNQSGNVVNAGGNILGNISF